jgi:hypothetical protein
MAGRLHIYYSQNKNFFRATFCRIRAKSGLFLKRKLIWAYAKLYRVAQNFTESRKTLRTVPRKLLGVVSSKSEVSDVGYGQASSVEGVKSCYSVSIPSKLLKMYSLRTIAMSPCNVRYLIRLVLIAVDESLGKGNKTIENQAR